MADTFSKRRRSEIMRSIKSTETSPELLVRLIVRRLRVRFRCHVQGLPGTPDLVFGRRRKIILVNGCFWHAHEGCKKGRAPRSNIRFWRTKLARNVQRDLEVLRKLKADGWKVLVVWQCELSRPANVRRKVSTFLASPQREV